MELLLGQARSYAVLSNKTNSAFYREAALKCLHKYKEIKQRDDFMRFLSKQRVSEISEITATLNIIR